MKNFTRYLGVLVALSMAGAASAATPSDYQAIVDAVDWSDVITGIGAIAALIAAVLIVRKGSRMLLSFLK